MIYAPFQMEGLNYNNLISPTSVHTDDKTTLMFERYLYFRFMSIYKVKIPENWDFEFLMYGLFTQGYVAVVKTDKYGVVPQIANAYGYDLYYQPNMFNVISPVIQLPEQRIGIDGEILRMTPDWYGIRDLVHFFAEKQALNSQAIDLSLINSKVAYILAGKNKAAAKALENIFDKIQRGEPAVAADKSILQDESGNDSIYTFNRDVKASFIVPELLECFRELDRIFDEFIGVPSVGTEKKERLTNEEVNANNQKTKSLAFTWKRMLDESIDRIVKLYPELDGKLSFEYNYDQTTGEEGGQEDGNL